MYKIRIGVNLSLPFTFTFRPEWQPIMDDYRRALQDPKIGKTKVDDYIFSKYGDIGYIITAPSSKNTTNLLTTSGAVVNQRKYGALLGEMDKLNVPGLVGFIASLGWNYYEKFAKQRDAALAQYGIKSVNSEAARQLGIADAWDQAVQSIKDYLPVWSEAYDNSVGDFTKTKRYIKGLLKTTQDKKWMAQYGKTNTMQAVSDYILNRDYLTRELVNRKANLGTQGISDPANADLKDAWDGYILQMKLWDNGFGDLYTRYLENDNYEVID
jgi:hypothetical protein